MSAYRDDLDAALARVAALEAEVARLREGCRLLNEHGPNDMAIMRAKVIVNSVSGECHALVSATDTARRRRDIQASGATWIAALENAVAFFKA